jgi:hypothetical protein
MLKGQDLAGCRIETWISLEWPTDAGKSEHVEYFSLADRKVVQDLATSEGIPPHFKEVQVLTDGCGSGLIVGRSAHLSAGEAARAKIQLNARARLRSIDVIALGLSTE